MFGRFTERAQRVIVLSQEEARRLGHNVVERNTSSCLIAEGEDVAALPVVSWSEYRSSTRRGGTDHWPRRSANPGSDRFTSRSKRVLELLLTRHDAWGTPILALNISC